MAFVCHQRTALPARACDPEMTRRSAVGAEASAVLLLINALSFSLFWAAEGSMGAWPRYVGLLMMWGVDDDVADDDDGVALLGGLMVSFLFSASLCWSLESRG